MCRAAFCLLVERTQLIKDGALKYHGAFLWATGESQVVFYSLCSKENISLSQTGCKITKIKKILDGEEENVKVGLWQKETFKKILNSNMKEREEDLIWNSQHNFKTFVLVNINILEEVLFLSFISFKLLLFS